MPTDAPKNITWRFQTPDVVEIVYDAPPEHTRNGQITKYEIQFWKGADPNQKKVRSTNGKKAVFANLDDNTEYKFSVRANTRKGYGPWSTQQTFRTDRWGRALYLVPCIPPTVNKMKIIPDRNIRRRGR